MKKEQIREQLVVSGDATLFIRMIGGYDDGPTLITLHGGPGISHEYLLPLAELADAHVRVVFYDQRQVGHSTGIAASSEPMQEWAVDLEAVRKSLGVERVNLFGHSSGGFPAIAYGSMFPEHVDSIIFVDSIPPTATLLEQAAQHMLARVAELQTAGLMPQELPTQTPEDGTAFLLALVQSYFLHPGTHDMNGATYRPTAEDRIMQALAQYALSDTIARLRMPTLSYISSIPFGPAMAGALYDALPEGNKKRVIL